MDMLEFALQYGREHPEATKEEVYDAYKTSKQGNNARFFEG